MLFAKNSSQKNSFYKSEKRFFLFTTVLVALPLFGSLAVGWYKENLSRIPEKRLYIICRDIKNNTVLPFGEKGTATIISSEFVLAFEGYSFYHDGYIGGSYRVDERYGGFFSPDSDPMVVEEPNGVTFSYLASKRTLTMTFKNHSIDYSDFSKSIKIGEKEFLINKNPIYLLIRKNGQVERH